MKRIKDIAFISTLSFTLFMLAFCAIEAMAVNEFGDTGVDAVRFANNALVLFVYSLCIGFSFLLFYIKPLSATVKRVLHFVLNYGLMMVSIFGFADIIVADAAATAFALSFVYLLVYFGGMLISSLLRKMGGAIDSAKK
ncbi:MAG: hypothetical protein IJC49_02490 [Clostridia bacterium]|nr:hypothetical protein [Clostridia bacterium]